MKYQEQAQVLSQRSLGEDICDLWIHTEKIAGEARPGQFLSLYCRDRRYLLPRPISICEIDIPSGNLRLVYRIAGNGTREFSRLRKGDTLEILGPLGNGFPLGEANTAVSEAGEEKEKNLRTLIVGGGIGVPPLLELAKTLRGEKTLVMGYRSRTYLEEDLRAAGRLVVATEDGSSGTFGNVMDAIRENHLEADVFYACGPAPMLRALKDYAAEHHMTAWISLEERMACGVGACLACVCETAETDDHSKVNNRRICREGPVFEAKEVVL